MRFQKGMPKPPGSGRKIGTPNKVQRLTRERLYERLSDEQCRLFDELNALEGRDYVNAYVKLLELAIGRTNNVNLEGGESTTLVDTLRSLSS